MVTKCQFLNSIAVDENMCYSFLICMLSQTILLTLSTSVTVSFLDFFQGIERLQRREAICEEVKNALKPFYRHKEISKENYKYIFSRAAEKVGIEEDVTFWLCVSILPIIHKINPALGRDGFTGWKGGLARRGAGGAIFHDRAKILKIK